MSRLIDAMTRRRASVETRAMMRDRCTVTMVQISGPSFCVDVYGVTPEDMMIIAEDGSGGGQQLRRRLEKRGVDCSRWVSYPFLVRRLPESY